MGLGSTCPTSHRVFVLAQPELWLVELGPGARSGLPREQPLCVGPHYLDDREGASLCEPQRIAEEVSVPAVMDRTERHGELRQNSCPALVWFYRLTLADLLADSVEPDLHVGYEQAEHCDLRTAEGVPEPRGERPPRQAVAGANSEHTPPVTLDVCHEFAIAVIPAAAVCGRFVDDAMALAVQVVGPHAGHGTPSSPSRPWSKGECGDSDCAAAPYARCGSPSKYVTDRRVRTRHRGA